MKLDEKIENEAQVLRFIFPQRATPGALAEYYGVRAEHVRRALTKLKERDVSLSFVDWTEERVEKPAPEKTDDSKLDRLIMELAEKSEWIGNANVLAANELKGYSVSGIYARLRHLTANLKLARERVEGEARKTYRYRLYDRKPAPAEKAERAKVDLRKKPEPLSGLREAIKAALIMGEDADLDDVVDLVSQLALKEAAQRGGQKGGAARARNLQPEERTQIAKKAAESRWAERDRSRGRADGNKLLADADKLATIYPDGVTSEALGELYGWDRRRHFRASAYLKKHGLVKTVFEPRSGRGGMRSKLIFEKMSIPAHLIAPQITTPLPPQERAKPIDIARHENNRRWRVRFRNTGEILLRPLMARLPELVAKYPNGLRKHEIAHEIGRASPSISSAVIDAALRNGVAVYEEQGDHNRKVLLLNGMLKLPALLSPMQKQVLDAIAERDDVSDTVPFAAPYLWIAGKLNVAGGTVGEAVKDLISKGYLERVIEPRSRSPAMYLYRNPQPEIIRLPVDLPPLEQENGPDAEAPGPSSSVSSGVPRDGSADQESRE